MEFWTLELFMGKYEFLKGEMVGIIIIVVVFFFKAVCRFELEGIIDNLT